MEYIREYGMYEHRDVDDFLVFEHVCVIDLIEINRPSDCLV